MKQSTDELSQALANAQDAGGVPLFLEQAVTDHLATPTLSLEPPLDLPLNPPERCLRLKMQGGHRIISSMPLSRV